MTLKDRFIRFFKDGFFEKIDWAAFGTATLLTLIVYVWTLGPSVGLEDSGELATAGAHLGVPHPPGYPFWTLCSWIFCKLFFFVNYMGHPSPAWCISLCSATFGAIAAGFTAMLICRSSRDFIAEKSLAFGGGVAGALTFALSPVEWSQSTIVEVYSLNAFFLMWVFLLSYRWLRKPTDAILWLTAFIFGLGLTNYQVLLFAIVPLAIIIAVKNIGLFRDVFIYLIPVALTWQVLQIGQLVRADRYMQADAINKHVAVLGSAKEMVTTPSTTFLIFAIVILVGSFLAAAYFRHRDTQKASKCLLYGGGFGAVLMLLTSFVFTTSTYWSGAEAVVAPLIAPTRYAVIAAFAAAAVVAGAIAAIQDEELEITAPAILKPLAAAAAFALIAILVAATVPMATPDGYAGAPYPWGKSTLVFLLVLALLFVLTSLTPKFRGLAFAIPVAGLHIAVFILLHHGAMNGLTHPCSWWFGWPIAWNFILLALLTLTLPHGISVAGAAFFAQLGVAFYAYMPIVSDLRNPPMNWGYPRTWEGFKHAIMRGQYEAIGVQSFASVWDFFKFVRAQMGHYFVDIIKQFTDVFILFLPVPFVLGNTIVAKEHRKTFWQWMGAAAACFLMMSFLLILLANVKGDIQDGFIQKVKFISSHAMIALWIGYGLVFAAAFAFRNIRKPIMEKPRARYWTAGIMIAAALVFPIIDNYTNDQIVFELGGAEQNGHTFGWQFGAYQLEGAKAIREQLIADEEPLPDPEYPPAMDPFSIFFGGTDPGRFVPTYMIYSANYRPDIYLITQNALADDTYMSVQRDLYGDEIWIPSKDDCADAFSIYVDEVKRGVRRANGDLKIENGRVQVTGALGVMEINGILTKMMFDHDRLRHTFYIEESYSIPWMYPYLSPHGLIMKINRDKTPYNKEIAIKDADFWDWYTRRLLADPMYRRDFAGQKSFSKLRAALAGLYNKQGHYREGSQAFREACLLYPVSPEAVFRYAQECLLPFKKYGISIELMDYLDLMDPNNSRTRSLREYVGEIERVNSEIARLEAKRQKEGKLDATDTFSYATCCFRLGRTFEAANLLAPLIDRVASPETLHFMITVFQEANFETEAEKALNRYLVKSGGDARAWCQLALIQFKSNRRAQAMASFTSAIRADHNTVQQLLMKDDSLIEIYTAWYKIQEAQRKANTNRSWYK